MSLINQMLRDLEDRQAREAREEVALPRGLTAPDRGGRARVLLVVAAALLLLLAALVAAWLGWTRLATPETAQAQVEAPLATTVTPGVLAETPPAPASAETPPLLTVSVEPGDDALRLRITATTDALPSPQQQIDGNSGSLLFAGYALDGRIGSLLQVLTGQSLYLVKHCNINGSSQVMILIHHISGGTFIVYLLEEF